MSTIPKKDLVIGEQKKTTATPNTVPNAPVSTGTVGTVPTAGEKPVVITPETAIGTNPHHNNGEDYRKLNMEKARNELKRKRTKQQDPVDKILEKENIEENNSEPESEQEEEEDELEPAKKKKKDYST